MSRKQYHPEDIINKLRQAEVELAKGEATAQVCKKLEICEQARGVNQRLIQFLVTV